MNESVDIVGFPEVLKTLRLQADLSQNDLAQKIGCDVSLISKYEHGTGPTIEMLEKIAKALGQKPEALVFFALKQRYPNVADSSIGKMVRDLGKTISDFQASRDK